MSSLTRLPRKQCKKCPHFSAPPSFSLIQNPPISAGKIWQNLDKICPNQRSLGGAPAVPGKTSLPGQSRRRQAGLRRGCQGGGGRSRPGGQRQISSLRITMFSLLCKVNACRARAVSRQAGGLENTLANGSQWIATGYLENTLTNAMGFNGLQLVITANYWVTQGRRAA